jgi:hypothetical protein
MMTDKERDQSPSQPNGAPPPEDADLTAELDAEFADLNREIERISSLPQEWAKEQQVQQLTKLRDDWLVKAREHKDRPQWQRKVEEALGSAFEKILRDGTQVGFDGKMSFRLNQDSLGTHGTPVLGTLLEGLSEVLAEKVRTFTLAAMSAKPIVASSTPVEPAAPSPAAAEAKEAPTPGQTAQPAQPVGETPQVQIKLDLQILLGALLQPLAKVAEQLKSGAIKFNQPVAPAASTDEAPAPGEDQAPGPAPSDPKDS